LTQRRTAKSLDFHEYISIKGLKLIFNANMFMMRCKNSIQGSAKSAVTLVTASMKSAIAIQVP